MRSKLLATFSICFLFLVIDFSMFFSPFVSKAQNDSKECNWVWGWEWEWDWDWEYEYNTVTGNSESVYAYRYKYRYKLRYKCAPTRAENKSDNAKASGGEIQKIWVDHNVYEEQKKGMRIHITFDVRNLKSKKCKANAYFYYTSGKPLKDFNDELSTTDGNVAMHDTFTPTYANSSFKDFQLFMPYDELHMGTGKYNLKFVIKLSCEGLGFFAESKGYSFNYSRSK